MLGDILPQTLHLNGGNDIYAVNTLHTNTYHTHRYNTLSTRERYRFGSIVVYV